MVTETKNPTQNTQDLGAGWTNPTYAYTSDDTYATASGSAARGGKWYGYGFSVPSGATINQFLVKLELKSSSPTNEYVAVRVSGDNGVNWSTIQYITITTSDVIYDCDFSSYINTPDKVNNLRVRVEYVFGGGCYPPNLQFLQFIRTDAEIQAIAKNAAIDWKDTSSFWKKVFTATKAESTSRLFQFIQAKDITTSTRLLGCKFWSVPLGRFLSKSEYDHAKLKQEIKLYLMPVQPVSVKVHTGTFTMIHAYFDIVPGIQKIYQNYAPFKALFNMDSPVVGSILGDICATDNHPINTRNKGQITFGELEIGDLLSEILWNENLWFTQPAPIVRIDKEEFKGDVYDIQFDDQTHIFIKYLIGHLSKEG